MALVLQRKKKMNDFRDYKKREETNKIIIHRFGVDEDMGINWSITRYKNYLKPNSSRQFWRWPELNKHFQEIYQLNRNVVQVTGTDKLPYHAVIGPCGELGIWIPHRLEATGALKYNKESLQLGIFGDFRKRLPNASQIMTACQVLRNWMYLHRLDTDCIFGHTDLPGATRNKNKVCPGPGVVELLKDCVINSISKDEYWGSSFGIREVEI